MQAGWIKSITFAMALLLPLGSLCAKHKSSYVIMHAPQYEPGMFSVFNSIIGFLDAYEKKIYSGIMVDFGDQGMYFDPQYGPNWWNYYCEPLSIGKKKKNLIVHHYYNECINMAYYTEFYLTRERVNELFRRYIKIHKPILDEVDTFITQFFEESYVIGIHYRGTDKIHEAPKLTYAQVAENLCKTIEKNCVPSDFRLFVATDEQAFLNYMREVFAERVVACPAQRSDTDQAIHLKNQRPYLQGKEALIDALLLSRCHLLLRTSSNLSLWSGYFNPQLPIIDLTSRYKHD